MKQFIKENLVLVIAFSLPVLLILAVALSAYLPSLFLSTKYDFIYASCADNKNPYSYNCGSHLQTHFLVANGKLTENPIDPKMDSDNNGILDMDEKHNFRVFLHDTTKNESREVSINDAMMLDLSGLLTSPDGVSVSGDYSRGGDMFFIFDSGSNYGHYLSKGRSKKKLNIINDSGQYYYQGNFQFIGWILPGRN